MSVWVIAETPKTTVHDIVNDNLHRRKVCVELVPKFLTSHHNIKRVAIASEFLKPDFWTMSLLATKHGHSSTKRQSSEWYSEFTCLKKARMSKSDVKIMFIVFFHGKCMVHK